MQLLKPLRTTDDLNKDNRGLGKAWLTKDKVHRELMFDCIQKANFSVQDFNKTTEGGFADYYAFCVTSASRFPYRSAA